MKQHHDRSEFLLSGSVIRDDEKETQYLHDNFKQPHKQNMRNFFMYRSRRELHLGFLYCYYLPDRIEEWYVNGMRHGIEYRYPLLDKEIVEYMLKVPSHLLVNGTWSRTLIREISEGLLPDGVRWRRSGLDPVSFQAAQNMLYSCSKEYMHDFYKIKENKDLDFINFEKLNDDINKYRMNPDDKKYAYLLYNIFNTKGLHEFTRARFRNRMRVASHFLKVKLI